MLLNIKAAPSLLLGSQCKLYVFIRLTSAFILAGSLASPEDSDCLIVHITNSLIHVPEKSRNAELVE